MNKRVLGIDTGTNSLGWAVVEKNASNEYTLLKRGSLVFQEGVKIEKGIESSKSSERTKHRALRKSYFRRRLRKIEVLKVLIKYGWCPKLSEESLHLWHTKKQYPKSDEFMLWQHTNDNLGQNPYYYRHICLHRELNLDIPKEAYMLGRALYHLAQRRGFLSNRLEQGGEEESGEVKKSISDLSAEMADAGCEFLGDYFYRLYAGEGNRVRLRSRYTDREEHYKKEFYAICNCQHLTEEQITELERALYFQRPLKSQRQGVGKCTFERCKPRCADSHPDYECFRMLSFINNIKVQGPKDVELRQLNSDEKSKILPLFFRKSKPQFDFEDIAKAIAGKKNYQHIKDSGNLPYKFNYRMSQGVTGCPTIASLKSVFGDDYAKGIAEVYTGCHSNEREAVDAVWNVLYSFADKDKLIEWAKDRLQLDDNSAETFAKVKLTHSFASLSLAAVRRILPWLEKGLIYSHAVMMAKIPDIVGLEVWAKHGVNITDEMLRLISGFNPKDMQLQGTLDFCIKDYLLNNFELPSGAADRLYHPSMIETYPDAKPNGQGIFQLGSPRTNAVRNPMAMRSLHQVRKVVNQLLRDGTITTSTEVHIEYARELNDSNKRKAIAQWNRTREKKRKEYVTCIQSVMGKDYEPSADELAKYQLWEEQKHICLYTGNEISLIDFIGRNPKYDIEHTIPRSVGGDSTMENMTLCSNRFNREIKREKLPAQLANHDEIMVRLDRWKAEIERLRKDLDRMRTHSGMDREVRDRLIQKRHILRLDLDYWTGKYKRFLMKEVPEGFARRQGAGIGLVGKYAGLYLKSLFHRAEDRNHSNVRVVKGAMTAEFRKMWGIQNEYEKKNRDNHIHHCIDAITIACMPMGSYNDMARYYQQLEEYERGEQRKPSFPKPWPTFTEDMKALVENTLVVHDTPDNMSKHARRYVMTSKGRKLAKGDSVRGSLHNDTYYGAIEREGEVRYVVRRALSSFEKETDLDNIVDDIVRQVVKEAVAQRGFKEAMASDIYLNVEKGVKIKKVRCYVNSVKKPVNIRQQRDLSRKDYKHQYHVANDGNYLLAIYEGEIKGKTKSDYELVRTIDAACYYKASTGRSEYPFVVPEKSPRGFAIKHILKIGQHVLLYENSREEITGVDYRELSKRLYIITGLNLNPTGSGYGNIVMRHHQEARMAKDVKAVSGAYKCNWGYRGAIQMLHTQFKALVEGDDFEINVLGEITFK